MLPLTISELIDQLQDAIDLGVDPNTYVTMVCCINGPEDSVASLIGEICFNEETKQMELWNYQEENDS